LSLNVSGHTGYWTVEDFAKDVVNKNSMTFKALLKYIASDFTSLLSVVNSNAKISSIGMKLKPEDYKELSAFTDYIEKIKFPLSKESYDKVSYFQSKYFDIISRKRAEMICGAIQNKLDSHNINCNPIGKGVENPTYHVGKGVQDETYSYDDYVKKSKEERQAINKKLRKVSSSITAGAVKRVENYTRKETEEETQAKRHDGYSFIQSDQVDSDEVLMQHHAFNNTLKTQFHNLCDSILRPEIPQLTSVEHMDFDLKSGETVGYRNAKVIDKKSGNAENEEVYIFPKGTLKNFPNATELSKSTKSTNLNDKKISNAEFDSYLGQIKEKVPGFDEHLGNARSAAEANMQKENLVGLPLTIKNLLNKSTEAGLRIIYKDGEICGKFNEETIAQLEKISIHDETGTANTSKEVLDSPQSKVKNTSDSHVEQITSDGSAIVK
jgi:hypothetical protein